MRSVPDGGPDLRLSQRVVQKRFVKPEILDMGADLSDQALADFGGKPQGHSGRMAALVSVILPGGLGIMQTGAGGFDLGCQIGQPFGMNLMGVNAFAVVGQVAAMPERLISDFLERVNDQAGLLECIGHTVLLMKKWKSAEKIPPG